MIAVHTLRKAILVVGMSRSGTSMIAHILHALVAALPDDLIGPDWIHPLGQWEPRGLVAINDEILIRLRLTWDEPNPLPDRWFKSAESRFYVSRIMAQVEQDDARAPLL